MIPIYTYTLTAENGEKVTGTLETFQYNDDEIFRFFFNDSADSFEIVKKNGNWEHRTGINNYPEYWVEELGNQIDEKAHLIKT